MMTATKLMGAYGQCTVQAAGLRVSEVLQERRSLEDLVLSVTGSGSDRIDRPAPAGPLEASTRARGERAGQ